MTAAPVTPSMKPRLSRFAPDSQSVLPSQHVHPRYDQRCLSFMVSSRSVPSGLFDLARFAHRRLFLPCVRSYPVNSRTKFAIPASVDPPPMREPGNILIAEESTPPTLLPMTDFLPFPAAARSTRLARDCGHNDKEKGRRRGEDALNAQAGRRPERW